MNGATNEDSRMALTRSFQFKVWISQFRMGGYFLKTFFPKQLNLKNLHKELYWTFMEIGAELIQIFDQRNWKYY